jgi:hypothetical protein
VTFVLVSDKVYYFAEYGPQNTEMESVFVREALLAKPPKVTGLCRTSQEKADGKVRCNVCERRCLVSAGGLGWCRTRENRDGELITLIYGAVSSLSANPIEKKPLFHFYPGTRALTGRVSARAGPRPIQHIRDERLHDP